MPAIGHLSEPIDLPTPTSRDFSLLGANLGISSDDKLLATAVERVLLMGDTIADASGGSVDLWDLPVAFLERLLQDRRPGILPATAPALLKLIKKAHPGIRAP
jgi:hypothetical protein